MIVCLLCESLLGGLLDDSRSSELMFTCRCDNTEKGISIPLLKESQSGMMTTRCF